MIRHEAEPFTVALKKMTESSAFLTLYKNNFRAACSYSTFAYKTKHVPLKNPRLSNLYVYMMYKYIQRRPESKVILGAILKCQAVVQQNTQFIRSNRKAFNDKTLGGVNNLAR